MAVHIIGGGIAGVMASLRLAEIQAKAPQPSQVHLYDKETNLFAFASSKNAGIARSYEADPALSFLLKKSLSTYLEQEEYEGLIDFCGLHIDPLEVDYYEAECKEQGLISRSTPLEIGANLLEGRLVGKNGVIDLTKLTELLEAKLNASTVEVHVNHELQEISEANKHIQQIRFRDRVPISLNPHDLLINAAGSWAKQLLEKNHLESPPLKPHKRHLFKTKNPWGRIFPVVWRERHNFYWLSRRDHLLLTHGDELIVEPDDYARDEKELNRFKTAALAHLPTTKVPDLIDWHACLRTFSLDRRPIIGFDPNIQNLFWVAALGGRGMSMCWALGDIIEAEISRGGPANQIENAFSPSRFY